MSAKYYENPTMLSRIIAKNIGDVFWDTVYIPSTFAMLPAKNYSDVCEFVKAMN